MAKRRTTDNDPFDAATRTRLRAVGRYEAVPEPGYCEVHFGRVPDLATDLAAFTMSWFLTGRGKSVPAPDDELFALWERYQAAHQDCCAEYRRQLFTLFSQSSQAKYTTEQWRVNGRSMPTKDDLRSVIGTAEVSLHQSQPNLGSPREYEVQVSFVVFWDEHGVAMRLRETGGGFAVAEWAGIGDL